MCKLHRRCKSKKLGGADWELHPTGILMYFSGISYSSQIKNCVNTFLRLKMYILSMFICQVSRHEFKFNCIVAQMVSLLPYRIWPFSMNFACMHVYPMHCTLDSFHSFKTWVLCFYGVYNNVFLCRPVMDCQTVQGVPTSHPIAAGDGHQPPTVVQG